MPITEAMSMGIPVVVTNWSGVTAFVDESVGYLVDYSLARVSEWVSGGVGQGVSGLSVSQQMGSCRPVGVPRTLEGGVFCLRCHVVPPFPQPGG
jgi:hypothetical protein